MIWNFYGFTADVYFHHRKLSTFWRSVKKLTHPSICAQEHKSSLYDSKKINKYISSRQFGSGTRFGRNGIFPNTHRIVHGVNVFFQPFYYDCYSSRIYINIDVCASRLAR